MDSFVKSMFGGAQKPVQAPISDDTGFADFASAADPSPASINPTLGGAGFSPNALPTLTPTVPFTKWYRVWERTQLSDFRQEMIILPFVLFVLAVHLFGARANRRKAHDWARHHGPALEFEFASVGFGGKKAPSVEDVQSEGLLKAAADEKLFDPETILRENAPNEYVTYATGRANTAFLDIKLSLVKRYNPLIMLGEAIMGFLFESVPPTIERMEASSYAFDGKESALVPRRKNEQETKAGNSTYDGFVWAIVHKNLLKRLREDRYDLSLTVTKDHAKLPAWVTVLSENGEITETLLTPELIKAVEDAGDLLDALIISDQPIEKPLKLDDTIPRKRMSLALRLPSAPTEYLKTLPLFTQFLRLPDVLVSKAHFRPEVLRKVKQTREDEIRRIKKVDEDEKAEERKTKGDKEKKEKRDALLNSMSSDEQRKFLEKEREKESRRSQKKRTMRA